MRAAIKSMVVCAARHALTCIKLPRAPIRPTVLVFSLPPFPTLILVVSGAVCASDMIARERRMLPGPSSPLPARMAHIRSTEPWGGTMNQNFSDPFSQFAAMFQQYQLPGFDVTAIMESRRKDVEALAATNRVAFGGMEALRDKQVEILRRTLSDLETIAKQFATTSTQPPFNANEVVQRALHNALADMQDIARTTQQTQAEAYALVSKRMEDALRELKASIEKPKT
ncbi:phasin family protein [Caballeronia sp. INDeC2]|uniref:phasin family protein n=1 Tax=Caballeronia sp. INDeC2 TaxID=2921747 RepID=UPI0020297330|nr:phasin family protein [Caballeronia sp. INDeC2]